jgi:uncharacterized protein YjbJ (UPF0337 family)
MVNKQSLAGNWNQLRGKLKEKWGKLTDDDLRQFSGNVDQLVGRIQTRTGESREAIEDFLDQLTDEGSRVMSNVRETIQQGAAQISERVSESAAQGYRAARRSYGEAERVVQERPGESMAMAFGLGFITGAALILLLRESHHERAAERIMLGNIARQIREGFARYLPESLVARR